MRSKDQILLENLYSTILKEEESVKSFTKDPLGLEGDPLGKKYLEPEKSEYDEVDQEEISSIQIPKELESNLNSALDQLVSIYDTTIKMIRSGLDDEPYLKAEKQRDKLKNIIISIKEFLGQE
jgi:hypothetical protein